MQNGVTKKPKWFNIWHTQNGQTQVVFKFFMAALKIHKQDLVVVLCTTSFCKFSTRAISCRNQLHGIRTYVACTWQIYSSWTDYIVSGHVDVNHRLEIDEVPFYLCIIFLWLLIIDCPFLFKIISNPLLLLYNYKYQLHRRKIYIKSDAFHHHRNMTYFYWVYFCEATELFRLKSK